LGTKRFLALVRFTLRDAAAFDKVATWHITADYQSVMGDTLEDLGAILAFVKAAELRSFTHASRALGITASGVGKSIARLETSLGVRLLHRTTRRVGLTDEGALFFEQCRRILDELESARGLMSNRGAAPRGRLRVSIPITIGKRIIIPELPRFLADHPDVELDLSLSDRHVNLVEDGIDVAVRIGSLADSSLVARPLGQQQVVTIASAAYLAADGVASLGDLALRRCFSFRLPSTGRERAWTFRLEGRAVDWRPRSLLTLDDSEALVAAARAGLGVTQVPSYMADDALASGELVEVLPHLRPRPDPIHAVFASRHNMPARTRAFVEFVTSLRGLRPLPLPVRPARSTAFRRRRSRPASA
jgi:DNA-binding transcriptional LysR family regulator